MNKTLSIIAGVALFIGLVVHILALSGIDISERLPFVWLLHVGIFVIWLPAILHLKSIPELKRKDRKPNDLIKVIFWDKPKILILITIACFVYATLNFILFMAASEGGVSSIMDGKFVLHNHGSIIRELTEVEYHKMKANEVRGFSGHWMAFYSVAMMVLWPNKNTNRSNRLTR